MTEELPKYSHLEIESQQNHTFPQNYVFPEAFGKTREQPVSKDLEEFFQQTNGTASANQQWLFNLPNGDRDCFSQNNTPKLGRSRSNYIPQRQQNKADYTSPYKDGVNGQPVNHFPDLSDVFNSEREMRSSCFNPYDDHFSQSIEQYTPQEFNQQVSSLQSLMAGDNETLSQDFPNIHKQTVVMLHDETVAEQCKIIASAMPSQLGRTFGTGLMERNGGENNQIFNYHAFQDQPGFSQQNTSYFEQQKPIFTPLNQYQSKATMHQRNMEQFSKQSKTQSKMRPPMQGEKRRMFLSGFPGDGVHARPNVDTPRGDEKRGLPQNLYFETPENMQFKRDDDSNNMIRAANAQKLLPRTWHVNDSRRMQNVNFNSSNVRPCGRAASGLDMGDVRSAIESAAFNFYDRGAMTRRGESNYHGNAPAMATSVVMNHSVLQLNFYYDECNEQWRWLEMEREKV